MAVLADQGELSSSLMCAHIESDSLSLSPLPPSLSLSPILIAARLLKQSTGFPDSWGPGGLSIHLNKLTWNWSSRVGTGRVGVNRAFHAQKDNSVIIKEEGREDYAELIQVSTVPTAFAFETPVTMTSPYQRTLFVDVCSCGLSVYNYAQFLLGWTLCIKKTEELKHKRNIWAGKCWWKPTRKMQTGWKFP